MKKTHSKPTTILSLLLTITLVFSVPISAFAEPEQQAPEAAITGETGELDQEGTENGETSSDDSVDEAVVNPGDDSSEEPADSSALAAQEQDVVELSSDDESATLELFATQDFNNVIVTISSALDGNMYVDIPRQSTEDSVQPYLWNKRYSPNQRFKFVKSGDYYSIVNIKSNKALDVRRSAVADRTQIIQYTASGGNNQLWKLIDNGNGSYSIASKLDETFCLDLSDFKATTDSGLILYKRDSAKRSQQFNLEPVTQSVANGVFEIQAFGSNRALDISESSYSNSAPLICYPASKGINQRFAFTYNKQTGYYTILSINSNKMLDVQGSLLTDGAAVIQYDAHGGFNQQWSIEQTSDGYYIYSALSGNVLDLPKSSATASTPIVMWTWHGGATQKWKINQSAMISESIINLVSSTKLNADVRGGSEANGADVIIYTRGTSFNQKFQIRKASASTSDTYVLECLKSGKLLTVDSASATNVYQYQGSGTGTTYQQWTLVPAGSGSFRLKNVATGKYLDYNNGTSGAVLKVTALGTFAKQAWTLPATESFPDGLYNFASALDTSLVFDIPGSSTEPSVFLALWTSHGGSNQVFKTTKLSAGRYTITNMNSGLALDVQMSAIDPTTGAGKVMQYALPNNQDNQIWDIQYVGGGNFRFVSILQNKRSCMTLASNSPTIRTSVDMLDINNSATQAFKPLPTGAITYYQMNYTLDQFANWQWSVVHANYPSYSFNDLKTNLNPSSKSGYTLYQFVDLRIGSGVTGAQLNTYIDSTASGRRGIFHGKGQAFVNAAKKYGLNEVYFLAHANLESAWGTSNFAMGNYYDGTRKIEGNTYPAGWYYNFWGIGAYDSNPNYAIDYAVLHGWNSPEAAIDGSAKWIADNYIYGTYPQPTVYAMRWDYARSNAEGGRGWHQYATSITWPNSIPRLMDECYTYVGINPTLYYVVPKFK